MFRFCSGRELLATRLQREASAARIDVWGIELDCDRETTSRFAALLDADEQARAARFQGASLRDRFTVAHGATRSILSRYLSSDGAQLRFATGTFGKPSLAGDTTLRFNLSHSDARALLAVTCDREVGADIERERDNLEALAIASRYFFGHEYRDIAEALPPEQVPRFFSYWVAKESVLKGEGLGIGYALERFGVQFDATRSTAAVATVGDDAPHGDWHIKTIDVGAGWHAAVAARGTDWVVRAECE